MIERCLVELPDTACFLLVLYAYLRHADLIGGGEKHDRRCRSSVVGYLQTCTSGTLALTSFGDAYWLTQCLLTGYSFGGVGELV